MVSPAGVATAARDAAMSGWKVVRKRGWRPARAARTGMIAACMVAAPTILAARPPEPRPPVLPALPDAAWLELLAEHDRVVRDHLQRYRGVEISHTGDGFVARFDGPARAVTCAARLLDGLAAVGITIRAGLHTGEVELIGDQVAGLAVHLAARIVDEAEPGRILISGTVHDLVAGSGIEFAPRGERRLKGVPGTWPLYEAVFVP